MGKQLVRLTLEIDPSQVGLKGAKLADFNNDPCEFLAWLYPEDINIEDLMDEAKIEIIEIMEENCQNELQSKVSHIEYVEES